MLGFLVALRNAMVILLLSWLGFEAAPADDREGNREDVGRAMIGMLR